MKRDNSFVFKLLIFYFVTMMATVLSLSGCIEEYEADISSENSDLLVIEGAICSKQLNKFILSHTLPVNSSSTPWMVVGAKVSVRGSDGTEYTTEANIIRLLHAAFLAHLPYLHQVDQVRHDFRCELVFRKAYRKVVRFRLFRLVAL